MIDAVADINNVITSASSDCIITAACCDGIITAAADKDVIFVITCQRIIMS